MIFNLGSINVDHVYRLDKAPKSGETIHAQGVNSFLGGKGFNISVAIHNAGHLVTHIGAINKYDSETLERIQAFGLETRHVARVEQRTGTAVILLESCGENRIVVDAGANQEIDFTNIKAALAHAKPDDWLVVQNETNLQEPALKLARTLGLSTALIPAPFELKMVSRCLPYTNLIVLNEVEYHQFAQAGLDTADTTVVITRGRNGSEWISAATEFKLAAFDVKVVDTTGAGDTFAGTLIAELAVGTAPRLAMELASATAAMAVTQMGAAASIPTRSKLYEMMGDQING